MEKDLSFRKLIDERIDGYTLMDDAFMTAVLDDNKEGVELILRTVLDKPDLEVVDFEVQREMRNLEGRTSVLDVLARDSSGALYDIEVQNDDRGAHPKRARYYSSLMDTHELPQGMEYESLHESYVIFIAKNDVRGMGLPLYHYVRREIETNELLGDGTHIVYVNGQYSDDGSNLGKLIADLRQTDPATMHFEALADKAGLLKGERKGVAAMGKFWEDIYYEALAEGRAEGLAEGRQEGLAEMGARAAKAVMDKYGIGLEEAFELVALPAELRPAAKDFLA